MQYKSDGLYEDAGLLFCGANVKSVNFRRISVSDHHLSGQKYRMNESRAT